VTALCITRNRRQWLPKAIQCFLAQTYSPLELLIVADGEDVRDLVPNDPRVRLLHLADHTGIGDKRNFGCDSAAGEVIAHWDDDDFSAPNRLSDQLARLKASGKAVTGYNAMRFTDGPNWWQYQGAADYALGTSLCYRKDWWRKYPFQSVGVGEDNMFVAMASAANQLTVAPAGDLMHATIHTGNTSPRTLGSAWTRL